MFGRGQMGTAERGFFGARPFLPLSRFFGCSGHDLPASMAADPIRCRTTPTSTGAADWVAELTVYRISPHRSQGSTYRLNQVCAFATVSEYACAVVHDKSLTDDDVWCCDLGARVGDADEVKLALCPVTARAQSVAIGSDRIIFGPRTGLATAWPGWHHR